MKHKTLAVGIVFLFIVTSVTPMVIGYTSDDVRSEREELLDNLAFMYYDDCGTNSNYEYYKEQLIKGCPNDDLKIVEPVESITVASSTGPMDSAWPMKCHDNRHTGRSLYNTPDNILIEKWRFTCDKVEGGSIIDNQGIIYFGDFDNILYALYPNGTLKWEFDLGPAGWVYSCPSIAEDGTIYVTSYDDYLHAVNPNGTEKWKFCAYDSITSSPAIGEDGTIYFGSMGPGNAGRIFAIYPNGTEKWHYDTGYWITSDPAIGGDGTIYIGSGDEYIYAMNPNGTLRWRFKTGHYVKGPPSIAEDGTVYIGSWDGYLYALYSNGTIKWKCGIGGGTETNPSISSDGTIYVGYDALYAVYPNGTIKWIFDLGQYRIIHQSSPAISADDKIYIGTKIGEGAGGEIIVINSDGSENWRSEIIGNDWVDTSPSIAEDGTIYIGSTSNDAGYSYGYLHAFGRGPLIVDAGGPYSGYAGEEIQFTGTVFGGIPPYSYHWDFGDEGTSDEQNPKYVYERSGTYIATFTVTDDEGNVSSDNATVTVDIAFPSVEITKPENALYLLNIKLIPLRKPLIIGNIDVEVDASQEEVGIDRVEFYIDDELRYTDTTEPYSWTWSDRMFFKHNIKVIAVDKVGKSSSETITVRKIF